MVEHRRTRGTFRNPVYGRPFADPMVLKFNGQYYAYGTPKSGGLPVLRSSDLTNWEESGEILGSPAPGLAHWAPEVAYNNGRFFLYYSTGGHEGENQQIRIASGSSPTGPFDEDHGILDADEPFTIDAHPFLDDDGCWYLFYSRDFLEAEPVGTGIVVDRLVDMTTLAGERTTVMRPHAEWHLYERDRRWYDRVGDWYTVEGPFVRKHDGRYWCFYSGGAWKAENYGVSSAVADSPMGPYEPVVAADTADVLRTVPGKVVGPGHGSAAVAPDNVTEYLLYHAWDVEHTGRFLHTDRLVWDEGRPQSPGPRVDDQPCPPEPMFRDLFDDRSCRHPQPVWRFDGTWEATPVAVRHRGGGGLATAVLDVTTPSSYLFEVNLAMDGRTGNGGRAGVVAGYQDAGNYAAVVLDPKAGELRWEVVGGGEVQRGSSLGPLRADFEPAAYHRLLIAAGPRGASISLDGVAMGAVPAGVLAPGRVGTWCVDGALSVAGVALTRQE